MPYYAFAGRLGRHCEHACACPAPAGDVWYPQPAPKDHPWRTMPNHAMTPHYSGTTLDAQVLNPVATSSHPQHVPAAFLPPAAASGCCGNALLQRGNFCTYSVCCMHRHATQPVQRRSCGAPSRASRSIPLTSLCRCGKSCTCWRLRQPHEYALIAEPQAVGKRGTCWSICKLCSCACSQICLRCWRLLGICKWIYHCKCRHAPHHLWSVLCAGRQACQPVQQAGHRGAHAGVPAGMLRTPSS